MNPATNNTPGHISSETARSIVLHMQPQQGAKEESDVNHRVPDRHFRIDLNPSGGSRPRRAQRRGPTHPHCHRRGPDRDRVSSLGGSATSISAQTSRPRLQHAPKCPALESEWNNGTGPDLRVPQPASPTSASAPSTTAARYTQAQLDQADGDSDDPVVRADYKEPILVGTSEDILGRGSGGTTPRNCRARSGTSPSRDTESPTANPSRGSSNSKSATRLIVEPNASSTPT